MKKNLFQYVRLIVQIVFLVLAPQTFSLAFSGVKQLFAALGKGVAFDANAFIILLVVLVVFTVVFGRFFCGYVCAFGTLGDILYKIVDFPLKKLHVKRPRLPKRVEDVLRCLKYVVLLFFIGASLAGVASVISVYSPWTAFGRILALNIDELNVIGLGILVLIAIGSIVKERFFCEFLCPLGAVFSLLPVLPFSSWRRHMPSCSSCGACQRACPVAVYPDADGDVRMGECISCGRCSDSCPHDCVGQCSATALAARLDGLALEADADAAAGGAAGKAAGASAAGNVRRNRLVRIVVLAVVLLVVFWLLNAVNFIPTLG